MSYQAKKSLGQHFLVDGNLQRKIVEAVDPLHEDEILEIGPGRGALTTYLAGVCNRLILVELDRNLAKDLARKYEGKPGVQVLQADILETCLADLTPRVQDLKVVGNIPYNITTPILFHLLSRPRPKDVVLMVQKEVGDRIVAGPGTRAFGSLTVGVQTVAEVERLFRVPASAFRPVPAVDSVVLRVRPLRPPPLSDLEEEHLRTLTRLAFQHRRKQFQSILRRQREPSLTHRDIGALQGTTGLDLSKRPETFTPQEFVALSRALESLGAGA